MNLRITLVYKIQVSHWISTCEVSFCCFVSKSVMSLNGLSFASARPTPQPYVPVPVEQGIQEVVSIISCRSLLGREMFTH